MSGHLVTIANPGWRQARTVPVGNLAVSWLVSRPGRLSCRLPRADAHRLPFSNLKGRWIGVDLGMIGRWWGIVEDDPGEIEGGTVELSAASMGVLLDKRIVPRTYRQVSGSPGGLIGRAITDSARSDPLWIRRLNIDEDGAPVVTEWRGDKLSRVVSSLANNAGGAWLCEPDNDDVLTFTYRSHFLDRRNRVLLIEGREIVAGSVRPTISTIVNDLTGVANDRQWERAGQSRQEDASSILEWGRSQDTLRYPGHTRESSLEFVTRADLARRSQPTAAVAADIPARHPILAHVRQGETVRLWSASTNAVYDLDIYGRAYQPNRGVVTITGTATAVAT